MSLTDRFIAAFKGSDLAHGQTTIGNKRRNGKTDAKSFNEGINRGAFKGN